LAKNNFTDVAENVLGMLKQRVSGDYLHTSAIIDSSFVVKSAVNDLTIMPALAPVIVFTGARWEEIKDIPFAIHPEEIGK